MNSKKKKQANKIKLIDRYKEQFGDCWGKGGQDGK